MALTETRPEPTVVSASSDAATTRNGPTAAERVLGSGDHKTIGRIFIGASVVFMLAELILSALVNLHAASGASMLESSVANRLWLNHPIGLLFCGVLPLILGLAIYVVPLQIGSPSVAFPRAAAMSLWGWLGGTILFSVAVTAKGSYGGSSLKMVSLGHVSVGLLIVSLLVGVVSVMTTIMSNRTAGMSIDRIPFFSFSMLVAGAVWLLTLPAMLATITFWQIRRPTAGDLETAAYPALEWMFHQPAAFLAAIPVLGIIADVASAVSGRRNRAYGVTQAAIAVFGALTIGAWAQSAASRETFIWVIGAVALGIPVVVVLATSVDTIIRGSKKATPASILVFVSGILLLFAALSALFLGVNTAGHNTIASVTTGGFGAGGPGIAVGQFYLIIAAAFVAGVAGVFHWGSRIWAGGLTPAAGLALAPFALLGGLMMGLGHIILGLAQPTASTAENLAGVSGIGALILAVVAVGTSGALTMAAFGPTRGTSTAKVADESLGGTLEWMTASPAGVGNFASALPTIESGYPLFDAADATNSQQGAQ